MKLIDHATATEDNEFTEGNPGTGTPATRVTAQWLNVIQAELVAILGAASIVPDQTGADRGQVLEAIQALIAAIEIPEIEFSSDAEAFAASVTDKAVVPSNFGTKTHSGSGYQKLPGGLIIQWGQSSNISNDTNGSVTFPITFPSLCASVVASFIGNDPFTDHQQSYGVSAITTSGFKVQNQSIQTDANPSLPAKWIAIGY